MRILLFIMLFILSSCGGESEEKIKFHPATASPLWAVGDWTGVNDFISPKNMLGLRIYSNGAVKGCVINSHSGQTIHIDNARVIGDGTQIQTDHGIFTISLARDSRMRTAMQNVNMVIYYHRGKLPGNCLK